MRTPKPECPACRVPMEEGFVPDAGDNNRLHRTRWTEGHAEKSLLKGLDLKHRRLLDTVTFRCPRCGWLIWFAPEAEPAD